MNTLKNSSKLKASMIFGLSLLGSLSVNAVAELWSPSQHLPVQCSYLEERADGLESRWYQLQSGDFAARWYPGGGWVIDSKASDASLSFHQRVDSSLKMEVFIFPPSKSFQALGSESLEAYAASLLGKYGMSDIQPDTLVFESPVLGSMPLLGHGYRKLSYRLVLEEDPLNERFVCDLITLLEDRRIFVLRYSGSKNFVEAIESDLASELRRFTLD